jgi:LacI family transcriptional regulator
LKKDREKITIVDIAEKLGISPATVSNALTGERHVKKETIEKVKKMVEEFDYRPNIIAKALRSKKRNIVGLIASNINNPFYSDIISGVEDIMTKNDYILVLNSTRFNRDIEIKAVKHLMNLLIDGLIFLGGSCDFSYIDDIVPSKMPIVFINRKVAISRYTEIAVDYRRAVSKIVGFLVKNGHRKIGYVGWKDDSAIIPNEKFNGYLDGLKEQDIEINKKIIFLRAGIPISDFREYREYAKDIFPMILKQGITAFVSQSDPIGLGLLQGLRESGLNIPDDISITGIGNINQSQTSFPPFTTIHIPKIRMGRFGAEVLLDLIKKGDNKKQTIYLKTTLINRGSVKDISGWDVKGE